MSRSAKILLPLLVPLMLACNFITQPFNQTRDAVETAQAVATALPVETLMALPTMVDDVMPTLEAGMTALPEIPGMGDLANMFDPKGEPVAEWKGIPVMPQAVAGQEFPDIFSYSYRAPVKVEEVTKFYEDSLTPKGWTSMFSMPPSGESVVLIYTGDQGAALTITVTPSLDSNGLIIILQLTQ
ncbi:MAG: hypothetical protein WHV44_12630 [Anaerolineales bacterium]